MCFTVRHKELLSGEDHLLQGCPMSGSWVTSEPQRVWIRAVRVMH